MTGGEPVLGTDVVDASRAKLAELRESDDPEVNRYLARMLADADRVRDAVAGFNSSL